jgi:hypothetical protein
VSARAPAVIDRNSRASVGGVPNAHSAPITPTRRATAAPPVNKQEKIVAAAIDDALAANAIAHSDAKPLEHVTKGRPRPTRSGRPTRATVTKIETRTETDESDEAQRAARQRVATMMGPSTVVVDEPAPPPPQILSRASLREDQPPPPSTTLPRASSREPDPAPPAPAPDSDDPPPPDGDDPPPPPPGAADSPLIPRQPSRGPQRRGPAPGVGGTRSPVPSRPLGSSGNAAVRGPSRGPPPPTDAGPGRGPAPARAAAPHSPVPSVVPVHAVGRGAAPAPSAAPRPAARPPPSAPVRAGVAAESTHAPPEPAPPVHHDSDDEDDAPPPPSAPSMPEHDEEDGDVVPPPQPDDFDDETDEHVHIPPPSVAEPTAADPPPPTPPQPTAAAIAAAVVGPPVSTSPALTPSPVLSTTPPGANAPPVARRSAGSAVQRQVVVSSPPTAHRGTPPQSASPTSGSPLVRQASTPDARRRSSTQTPLPSTLSRGQSMLSSSAHAQLPSVGTPAVISNESPSGWLEKKGLKRFFVLRQKTLYWFKDKVDANGTVPELAKHAQKSLILTNSRKITKAPKKPGVVISSEKEKSYELFAASPEEADRWFNLLVHAQALPMGASGGVTLTNSSPPGSPAAPRNPSPAQAQQQQPPQPQLVKSPSRGPVSARGPQVAGRGPAVLPTGAQPAKPGAGASAAPAPAGAGGGSGLMFDNGVDLRTFPWFEPKLAGDQASQRLAGKALGTFCVRPSSSGSNLVISYVQGAQGQVLHVSVKPTPEKEWLMDGCERPFKSIQALLVAYKETYRLPLSLSENKPPTVLPSPRNVAVPVPDEEAEPNEPAGAASAEYMDGKIDLRAYPWYHGEMSAQDAFDLLQGKPEGAFLVRYSVNNPGGFVITYVSKADGILMHLLVKREPQGLMPTAGPKHFPDMVELLRHYLPAFDVPIAKQK